MIPILIISFSVMAIWFSMQEGEIFGRLGNWMHDNLPEPIHKPIFDCPICMTPWYGTIIYLIAWPFHVEPFILTILPAMGLNVIIVKLWPDKD